MSLYGARLPASVMQKLRAGQRPGSQFNASSLAQFGRQSPEAVNAIAQLAAAGMDVDAAAAAVGNAAQIAGMGGVRGTKELCAGFEADIAAGSSVSVEVRVQVPFDARSLWFSSDTASNFTLEELKLGVGTNLITAGSAPCQVFSELGQGIPWQIGVAQVGQAIIMRIRNVTSAAAKVRGIWWGTAILPAGQ